MFYPPTANWKEVLQKYVAPDQLPIVYGGTMTDPNGDPYCKTMVSTFTEICVLQISYFIALKNMAKPKILQ